MILLFAAIFFAVILNEVRDLIKAKKDFRFYQG